MSYVFDNSPLSALFKNFYRRTFRSLWENFDALVEDGRIVSTREALREIEDGAPDNLLEWARDHQTLFATPTAEEARFVARIYGVAHFQQNIEQQKLLKGGRNADPFVIAKAAIEGRAVVTMELFRPNAAKIPNICRHFDIPCFSLRRIYGRRTLAVLICHNGPLRDKPVWCCLLQLSILWPGLSKLACPIRHTFRCVTWLTRTLGRYLMMVPNTEAVAVEAFRAMSPSAPRCWRCP